MKVLVVLACCLAAAVAGRHPPGRHPLAAYADQGVVPDVIDVAPPAILKVVFGTRPQQVSASLGGELTPTQVQSQPAFSWPNHFGPGPHGPHGPHGHHRPHRKDSLHTLILVDTDANGRTNNTFTREYVHMLLGNIPGEDVSRGEVVFNYVGPAPPQGAGLHRYVVLAYKQPGYNNYTSTPPASRQYFSSRRFAASWDLGAPVAANFFQVQNANN
ncbi:protein D3-like [Thrips palmi]|uniref:Protein D3-like n=1 Tax=Thrips palmi TaxID=161013 RepID=A0A6P9AIQ6_THRPL|nr:protein D3-like [Thrips palmi]